MVEGCFLYWRPESSDILQDLMLGPSLLVQDVFSRFVDNINIGTIINSEFGYQESQHPDELGQWAEELFPECSVAVQCSVAVPRSRR